MRTVATILALLLSVTLSSAQQVEGGDIIVVEPSDSAAMAVIARYVDQMPQIYPHHDMMRRPLLPPRMARRLIPQLVEQHVWENESMRSMMRPDMLPMRNPYSVVLRIGNRGSAIIVISNGSAFNYMPWPNSPIGYRDARTLSFPLPQ